MRPVAFARRALAALSLSAFALGARGCVHVAEDRARMDLTVGKAQTAALVVDVEGGLACVRDVSPGALALRAQAPSFRAKVRVKDGARSLALRLENVDAGAAVLARAEPSGDALAVEGLPAQRRKQILARVSVPPGGDLVIEVRAPDADARGRYDVGVLADVQEAIGSVGEVYAKINAVKSLRFLLFTGDLTRRGSREELDEFERREQELDVPLYATLGNHELGADRVYFQEMYGRASTSFVHRGVRFTLLDSASATLDPLVYGWLEDWLAAGRGETHVVGMHIPPLDPAGLRNGAFASRAEAAKLVARLAEGQVDLTLYGHVHSFYAYANGGIPAYISGGGGAIPERLDGVGRNFLVVSLEAGGPAADKPTVAMVRVGDGP